MSFKLENVLRLLIITNFLFLLLLLLLLFYILWKEVIHCFFNCFSFCFQTFNDNSTLETPHI